MNWVKVGFVACANVAIYLQLLSRLLGLFPTDSKETSSKNQGPIHSKTVDEFTDNKVSAVRDITSKCYKVRSLFMTNHQQRKADVISYKHGLG